MDSERSLKKARLAPYFVKKESLFQYKEKSFKNKNKFALDTKTINMIFKEKMEKLFNFKTSSKREKLNTFKNK